MSTVIGTVMMSVSSMSGDAAMLLFVESSRLPSVVRVIQ